MCYDTNFCAKRIYVLGAYFGRRPLVEWVSTIISFQNHGFECLDLIRRTRELRLMFVGLVNDGFLMVLYACLHISWGTAQRNNHAATEIKKCTHSPLIQP